jgi:hypothetical protein
VEKVGRSGHRLVVGEGIEAVSPTRRPGGLVGQAVVTTFPIRKYLGGELLGSKNGMKLIRNYIANLN